MSKVINYINIYDGNTFSFDKDINLEVNIKNKKIPIGTRLPYKDIFSHSFRIEKSVSKEELLVKTELKMYEDIGLDPTKPYKIIYIEKKISSDSEILIEAFAVDKLDITEKYKSNLKKVKHLDYIAVPFLTFETLYSNNLLTPKNDIFIYISDDEAFTTSYLDGKYISSKHIKTLNEMVKELENKKIYLTLEELKTTLSTKGLDKNSYELLEYEIHEYLVEEFSTMFSKIKSLSLHNRNVYGFSQIDRVFVSCDGSALTSLAEHVEMYIEDAEILPFDFFKQNDIDALDVITASFIKDKISKNDNTLNLTIFHKTPPFYKSEVGKFALASVASTLFIASYPAYLAYEISNTTDINSLLKEQEATLSISSKKLKKQLTGYKGEIAALEEGKKVYAKKLSSLKDIANELLELKSKDTKYTSMFLKINKILKNYQLSLEKITQVDKNALNIELSSTNDKRNTIALLMKDLLNEGFSSVTSGEITLNDDKYTSTITIKR